MTGEAQELDIQPLKAKEALGAHGPTANMAVSLQRYALLGWVLFGFTALVFVIYVFIQMLRPEPVIAVDESGRISGTIEYLDGTNREDGEVIAALKRWIDAKRSANSSTIYQDVSFYLSMLSGELYQREIKNIADTLSPAVIEKAGTTSRIEWDDRKTRIVKRNGVNVEMRMVGKLIIGQKTPVTKQFDIGIAARIVARTPLKSGGMELDNYWYN